MAKRRLTAAELKEKRDYAKILYIREKLSQKEIASKIDISQNTISKWATEDNWGAAQKSLMLTREEQLRKMMDELDILNSEIADGDLARATKEQAYIRTQLIQDIKKLETDVSASEAFEVGQSIIKFYRQVDLDRAKELTEWFDTYIKTLLK